MSVSSKVQLDSHVKQHLDREKTAITAHVDATVGSVKTEVDAVMGAASQLLGLRPVAAITTLVEGTVQAGKQLIVGNIDASLDNVKDQAAIVRSGRV